MTEQELETLVHEAYAAHTILVSLRYEPDEVTVGIEGILNSDPPGLHACVRLDRDERSFVLTLAPVTKEEGERFLEAMRIFIESKASLSRERLDEIVHTSQTWQRAGELLMGLKLKGFDIRLRDQAN